MEEKNLENAYHETITLTDLDEAEEKIKKLEQEIQQLREKDIFWVDFNKERDEELANVKQRLKDSQEKYLISSLNFSNFELVEKIEESKNQIIQLQKELKDWQDWYEGKDGLGYRFKNFSRSEFTNFYKQLMKVAEQLNLLQVDKKSINEQAVEQWEKVREIPNQKELITQLGRALSLSNQAEEDFHTVTERLDKIISDKKLREEQRKSQETQTINPEVGEKSTQTELEGEINNNISPTLLEENIDNNQFEEQKSTSLIIYRKIPTPKNNNLLNSKKNLLFAVLIIIVVGIVRFLVHRRFSKNKPKKKSNY